ncbi:class I SAM-dependent methyltransferase [Streptomyces sp. NBC_01433]|uniref:O-methyltransferase n=1 Tax=Streptomyces sp. NBC_01433 TaxID=2903864 RepID=UPI002257242E|nr:class I SAM-dependent methyltransferase [Streptomyces sp. NBC_01433]MCX4680604.1 class I SAM-dependent methyltransferase [Streptomyces sp. NBC_01433]
MRPTLVSEALHEYIVENSLPVDDAQLGLMERTTTVGDRARMRIGTPQGTFFTFLAQMMSARKAIEVGTFTGYSALSIARGLPADGHLLTCDVNEEWTAIAQDAWKEAGVADRIELRLGPALDTLRSLPTDPEWDLAFIDADKANYTAYYEELVPRMRPGGVILVDNVLWFSTVVDDPEGEGAPMRAFNAHVAADPRVEAVILSIGDGVTVVRKKAQDPGRP